LNDIARGADMLHALRAMYAFAIYDAAARTLRGFRA
jgi:asparagine synthetase B (glutamine-hydrolysing)